MAEPIGGTLHFPAGAPPPDQDVLDADEARRYLRLYGRKFEEVATRLPWTHLGRRTRIISRRLLLEWVEANASITDPHQLQHRRHPRGD